MATVLYMSVSVDGYVSTPDDFLGGDDGNRLHDWYAPGGDEDALTGEAKALAGELDRIGSVVTGRRTAELMDHWGGDVHNGVPIFIPSHRPPGPAARWGYPNVTYVLDGITSAMKQAVAAAGDRDVYVQGGYTAQKALEEGVLDEIQLHLIPVLLGGGHRLFDVLPSEIELEIVKVIDTPHATHIRYRVLR
ncbi:dihydrofolate reductase family protein [Leifsonia sp. 1010]|uniref:dihydrofolate reductase family protein n=1 Tax=Leifsonia sp. 1010 TaxID=2817769 RepID=UPI00285B2618|nr:dihydrofolate reductase family protein [Leifsonia sp. 1010]MDR6613349.1 dihydrofolate reductase [Leifsonia sp. 1010]